MQDPTRSIEINQSGHAWLRILIASYFSAVALRLIPGTDFTLLLDRIADAGTADLLTSMIVFSLAYMVMIGCYLRLAALLLALMSLFSAFVGYVGPTGAGDLGAFWRDIALVSALMLTYSRRARPETQKSAAVPVPAQAANVTNLAAHRARISASRPMDLRAPLGQDEIENIFLDYAEAR